MWTIILHHLDELQMQPCPSFTGRATLRVLLTHALIIITANRANRATFHMPSSINFGSSVYPFPSLEYLPLLAFSLPDPPPPLPPPRGGGGGGWPWARCLRIPNVAHCRTWPETSIMA